MKTDAIFRIASMTKPVTSVERGQDPGGILGDFRANWLRISRKIPSKSLIA
jgi:hypothetical protein